jgi:hypothetical protein
MPVTTSDNNFGVAKWIVDPVFGNGTHTTIASALTSASAGDTIFIRTGTYVENITLKAGVNLTGFDSDMYLQSTTGLVTIDGLMTATYTGTVSISSVRIINNGNVVKALTFSGSQATVLNFFNCRLAANAKSFCDITNSNAASSVNCYSCTLQNTGSAGNNLYTKSGASVLNCFYCQLTAPATSNNPCSAGVVNLYHCFSNMSYGTSSSGVTNFYNCVLNETNVTCFTTAGTGTSTLIKTRIFSGTASALSIGSGTTVNAYDCEISSTNTNAVTGAGTLNQIPLSFTNTSSGNNVTTNSSLNLGRSSTWTPVVTFGGGNTGLTFTTAPTGKYWVIGKLTYFNLFFQVSAVGSSTGNFQVTLPSTADNDSSAGFIRPCNFSGTGVTFPASTSQVIAIIAPNTNYVTATGIGATGVSTQITHAHFSTAAYFGVSGFYWTA